MKLRIVSSKEEINSLSKGEKIIHLGFRPSNKEDIPKPKKDCGKIIIYGI